MVVIATLITVWMMLQLILRVAHMIERGPKSHVAHILSAGLIQDFGIALVAFGMAQALAAQGADLRNLGAGVLLWTLTVGLFIDHRIHTKIGTRLHSAIASLHGIRSLLSSALELGLIRLAGQILILSVLVGVSVPLLAGQAASTSFHPIVSVVGGIPFALLGHWWMPRARRYSADNLIPLLVRDLLVPAPPREDVHLRDQSAPDQGMVLGTTHPLFRKLDVRSPTQLDVRRHGMPHVLIIFMESFRSADVGALGSPLGATPNFDRWSKRGMLFSNFYANSIQTTRALTATLYGLLPGLSLRPTECLQPTLRLRGLPHILSDVGYRTSFWYGGDLTFQNRGRILQAHGFADIVGGDDFMTAYPQARATTTLGVDDEYVFELAMERLMRSDAEGLRAFGVLLTLSHHHPWRPPREHLTPTFEATNDVHRCFLRTMHYSDACLGAFLDDLSERGILDRTIVVVLGDHGQPMGERDGNFQLWGHLYEESLRVPLLILGPARIPEGRVDHSVCSQVDVLPTILDILGMDTAHHAFGSSLLRRCAERTSYFANPFGGGFIGLRSGAYKLIIGPNQQEPLLFNLDIDLAEQHDRWLAHQAVALELERKCRRVFLWNEKLYASNAFAPQPSEADQSEKLTGRSSGLR